MTFTVGVLDRTGQLAAMVPEVLDRLGVEAEVLDLGLPADFGPDTERADVLLLGPKEVTALGLRRVMRYRGSHLGVVVVGVGIMPDGPTKAELRAYGVTLTLRGQITTAKLITVVDRAVDDADRLAAEFAGRAPAAALEAEPESGEYDEDYDEGEDLEALEDLEDSEDLDEGETPASLADEAPRRAVLLTVASATGGCGKTFFATNLAALVARSGHKALLVDLDLQFGEVAAALRVRHPYSVYDGLYDAQGRPLPETDLEQHLDTLVHHHPLGFDVLTAPRDPALADYVGARDATKILDVVLPRYEVVVVDTPPSLNEVVLTALDRSDVVAVLVTLDVPSLKNLSVFQDTLRRLRIDDSRVRLVLNKVEADIGIDVAQAQDAFDNRFVGALPLSRAVSRAINAGTVVVELEPRNAVSRTMVTTVSAVLPEGLVAVVAPPAEKTGFVRRIVASFRGAHAET